MRKEILLFSLVFVFFVGTASGLNNKRAFNAVKVTASPKIDGKLDDVVWSNIAVASDFVQYSPYNGKDASFRTEVKIIYDQTAIYVAAMMYDPFPDSILTVLGERDSDRGLNADHFSFDINPFNDGVNGMTFKVSASNVKTDKKVAPSSRRGSDTNWDAVWNSAVDINSEGWSVELKIPYSAIRFSDAQKQVWGVNFWREIRRKREWSTWNYVDNEVGNTFNYLGDLQGINSVDPPFRLSFTPYLSGYLEKNSESNSWSTSYNGGMDLKLGINESFTLDMTLIPDFGQVQSDDVILNLTPFEVKYNEKRQFFTEGTELFNKGNIFYSRRIGDRPSGYGDVYDDLSDSEIVTENPSESKLINATKVSGRTDKGLGIGFFNAMSNRMYAEIEDTITGVTRSVLTQPFTNYNMLVLDQSLRNNSYFSFQNTNVWRDAPKSGDNYTANVTSTDFKILDKSNMYSIFTQAAISQKYFDSLDTDLGYRIFLNTGKTGGTFRAEYQMEIISDRYDPNDMGYERNRNEMKHEGTFSYNIYKPIGILQNSRNSFQIEYVGQYKPSEFSTLKLALNTFTGFMNFWYTRLEIEYTPVGTYDFYEPRVDNRSYFRYPEVGASGYVSTDSRKKLYARLFFEGGLNSSPYDQSSYRVSVEPTYRVNDKLKLAWEIRYGGSTNDIGYVDRTEAEDSIYFGMRNIRTVENTIEVGYIFTSRSYLNFRLRHYWSKADYSGDYYLLQEDGYLASTDSYPGEDDINFNTFNIDMSYVWRFAPGSELSFVWKNSIYSISDQIPDDFIDNLNLTFDSPMVNSFSLKILYYLDYQYLRRKSKKA